MNAQMLVARQNDYGVRRALRRSSTPLRPKITTGHSEFSCTHQMVGLPQGDSPLLLNASCTITVDIEVPEAGAEGLILSSGGRSGGYGVYMLKGRPVFLWNPVDLKRIKWEGPEALTRTLKEWSHANHRSEFGGHAAIAVGSLQEAYSGSGRCRHGWVGRDLGSDSR